MDILCILSAGVHCFPGLCFISQDGNPFSRQHVGEEDEVGKG